MPFDKKKMFEERRVSPRYQLKIDVNYRHDETYLFSSSENLSEFGVFLVSDHPFEKGTRLELRFNPPGGVDPLEVEGEVVWIEKENSDNKSGMGIRFIEVSPAAKERIKTLIRTVAYLE